MGEITGKIYCEKCGKELKYDQNFCNNCGTKNSFLNKEMFNIEKKKKEKKSFVKGILIFLGLTIILLFILKGTINHVNRETENSTKEITSYDCEAFTLRYNDLTDEKKDEFVESHKGDLVEWTGYVSDVYSDHVALKYNRNDLISDAFFYYDLLETRNFKKLNKGDKIKVQGIILKKDIIWFLTDTKLIQTY